MPTDFGSDNKKHHPQKFEAAHPQAFKIVPHDKKENKRQQVPRPSRVAVCDAPNAVQGCDDEDVKESKADILAVAGGFRSREISVGQMVLSPKGVRGGYLTVR